MFCFFFFTSAIDRLLTVAGTQKLFKTLAITELSRMHASVALSTVYDDLINDKQREQFKNKCSNFLKLVVLCSCVGDEVDAIYCTVDL